MSSQPATLRVIRFGLFELDLSAETLRKQGREIKLQEQPFQVLVLLLSRPGEVVTREDLQKALWPADTFIEFDQGLNTAIKKIRLALGDSADNPRFVETIPRKGYRFIAPVGERETLAPISVSTPIPASAVSMRRWWWLATVLLAAISAVLLTRDVGQDLSRLRYTPFAMNPEGQSEPFWSPDGKSVAYVGSNGRAQVFVRNLNSPAATQLTKNRLYAYAKRWSPDSKRVLFLAPGPDSTDAKKTRALYSITVVGGEAELITTMPDYPDWEVFEEDLSPDNQTMAIFAKHGDGKETVFISSPLGSPYRQYEPAPFTNQVHYNAACLRFAPNGKKLLLIRTGDSKPEEAWLLPYPPGTSAPHRVLTHFPVQKLTSNFCWLPDSRHVALALSITGSPHLWIADTESSDSYQITGGTANQDSVSVAPDGRQIIYSEYKLDLDITAVSLLTGKSQKLIASDALEQMPAWSAKTEKLAYVTERNGPMEIWMRSADGSDQPLITQKDFSGNPTRVLLNPALSPDGKTLIFARVSDDGTARAWIMSLSGGAPERLNDSATDTEFGGMWSPDGRRFAELAIFGSSMSLVVIRVGSHEKPVIVRDRVNFGLPDWSPNDEWLTFQDDSGWHLVSPDGKTVKPLGPIASRHLAFSKDGRLLYGIREKDDKTTLFSLNISTMKVTDIQELVSDLAPSGDKVPGIRFSLSPDGNSFAYTTAVSKSNLWILEGFRQPDLLSRLGLKLLAE